MENSYFNEYSVGCGKSLGDHGSSRLRQGLGYNPQAQGLGRTRHPNPRAAANQKTGEALSLLTQFQLYAGQPVEIVTKARIFDETMAKGLSVTGSKVINIVID